MLLSNKTNKGGRTPALSESRAIRTLLICTALLFLSLFLLLPLVVIFVEALQSGVRIYYQALIEPDALAAIRLTLLTAMIAVPLNLSFGLAASWLITKYRFRGRGILLTLIDIPLAVSPVIAGMVFVLLYGSYGMLGPILERVGLQIIFAPPGIIIATTFVTVPYIARELIPLMQQQGTTQEEAALTLGASGWQTFLLVTLPNIKWGLVYGVILCNARAMGEFGAVAVVSGHIRGLTNTMPLHVEVLYNEYQFEASFALASLLAMLAILTLVLKFLVEWQAEKNRTA